MHFPLVWKLFRFLSHFLSRDSTIAHFVHTSPVTVSIQYKYLRKQSIPRFLTDLAPVNRDTVFAKHGPGSMNAILRQLMEHVIEGVN